MRPTAVWSQIFSVGCDWSLSASHCEPRLSAISTNASAELDFSNAYHVTPPHQYGDCRVCEVSIAPRSIFGLLHCISTYFSLSTHFVLLHTQTIKYLVEKHAIWDTHAVSFLVLLRRANSLLSGARAYICRLNRASSTCPPKIKSNQLADTVRPGSVQETWTWSPLRHDSVGRGRIYGCASPRIQMFYWRNRVSEK